MKINNNYLDKFIKAKDCYMYPITKGIYLTFDITTLEYIDVVMYYLPKYHIDKYANEKLEELYSRSYLI